MTGAIFISDDIVILDTSSLLYKNVFTSKAVKTSLLSFKLLYYPSNFFIILQTPLLSFKLLMINVITRWKVLWR